MIFRSKAAKIMRISTTPVLGAENDPGIVTTPFQSSTLDETGNQRQFVKFVPPSSDIIEGVL